MRKSLIGAITRIIKLNQSRTIIPIFDKIISYSVTESSLAHEITFLLKKTIETEIVPLVRLISNISNNPVLKNLYHVCHCTHETSMALVLKHRQVIIGSGATCGVVLAEKKNAKMGHFKTISVCDDFYRNYIMYVKTFDTYMDGSGIAKNFDIKTLLSLIRHKGRYSGGSSLTTFDNPLSLHHRTLSGMGLHHQWMISVLKWAKDTCDAEPVISLYIDDLVRKTLSSVDNFCYNRMYHSSDKGFSDEAVMLYGLKTLGGPRGWRRKEVVEDVRLWVNVHSDNVMTPFEEQQIKHWISLWCLNGVKDKMTFDEFQTDATKWATSGGAPPVLFRGETIRSKWAWAFTTLKHTKDVYQHAKKTSENVAHVALKEEVKTRAVITTPMDCYLRQSYILYMLGKYTFLKSTLNDPKKVELLVSGKYRYYTCIDAKQFDHCMSKAFIISFWTILRENITDELRSFGLVDLINDEINHINNLRVEIFGDFMQYRNGLLSGWRMTSFLGSLKSALVCELIIKTYRLYADYIVQGDDIIIVSNVKLPITGIIELCAELGVKTDATKTTSGASGEFLKYNYTSERSCGYPTRAIRSIFYANPWIDSSIKTSPQEVVTSWHTYISRMMVSSNSAVDYLPLESAMVDDVTGWLSNIRKKDVKDALSTPQNVGGLGVIEACDNINQLTIIQKKETTTPALGEDKFFGLFGIVKKTGSVFEVVRHTYQDKMVKHQISHILYSFQHIDSIIRDESSNVMLTLFDIVLRHVKSSEMMQMMKNCVGHIDRAFNRENLPYQFRKSRRWYELIQKLVLPEKTGNPQSYFTSPRLDSRTMSVIKSRVNSVVSHIRTMTNSYRQLVNRYVLSMFLETNSIPTSL